MVVDACLIEPERLREQGEVAAHDDLRGQASLGRRQVPWTRNRCSVSKAMRPLVQGRW